MSSTAPTQYNFFIGLPVTLNILILYFSGSNVKVIGGPTAASASSTLSLFFFSLSPLFRFGPPPSIDIVSPTPSVSIVSLRFSVGIPRRCCVVLSRRSFTFCAARDASRVSLLYLFASATRARLVEAGPPLSGLMLLDGIDIYLMLPDGIVVSLLLPTNEKTDREIGNAFPLTVSELFKKSSKSYKSDKILPKVFETQLHVIYVIIY